MSTRMNAEDRRELILEAATRAFARGGYFGTSTDAVAKEAGVSQPYVVRMFGTKLELFLEVYVRVTDRIRDTFAAIVDTPGIDWDGEEGMERLGGAYFELLHDRDQLMVMMHGFSAAGAEPTIAAQGRRCMGEIYATARRTGWSAEAVRDFVAYGMMLNVLTSIHAPEHVADGGPLADLTTLAFGADELA